VEIEAGYGRTFEAMPSGLGAVGGDIPDASPPLRRT
ncbi:MAG: hypothetical protein ACI9VR_001982, partial [Cognaticolwellia sp.]